MKRQRLYFNKIKKLKTILLISSSLLITTTCTSIYGITNYHAVQEENTYQKEYIQILEDAHEHNTSYINDLELLCGSEVYSLRRTPVTIDTEITYGTTNNLFFSSWISKQPHMKHLEKYFLGYSTIYNIDVGFAAATFVLEVGRKANSKNWLDNHNPAGIKTFNNCKVVNGYCHYKTEQEGIEAMYQLLALYYSGERFNKRLTTVKQVRDKWSEAPDEERIVEIWNEIMGG